MSFLWRALLGRRSMENPSTPLSDPDDWLYDSFGAGKSEAGVSVSRESALSVSAWWRGINLLSGDVAKMPPIVYRRDGKGAVHAVDHPAYQLLRYKPNPWMTSFTLWQTMLAHRLSEGNGYALVERDGAGRATALLLLDPMKVTPVRVNGRPYYAYEGSDRRTVSLAGENVLHFKGLSYDGLRGYSVVAKAKETLGVEIAMREHGARFFGQGARPGVLLEHPATMSEEAQKRFMSSWKAQREGVSNAYKTLILEEGMKASPPMTMSAEDSQFIESRSFEVREIANFIGVPPSKLGDTASRPYASLEQDERSYLNSSLEPILVACELEIRDKLLTEEEKRTDTHYVAYDRTAFVSADVVARNEAYGSALAGLPYMTVNEVRARENLNPIPGYDQIIVPINLQRPATTEDVEDPQEDEDEDDEDEVEAEEPAAEPTPPDPAPDRAAALAEVRAIHADARRRMLRRLATAASKPSRSADTLQAWLDTMADEHGAVVRAAMGPPCRAIAALGGPLLDGGDVVIGEARTVCLSALAAPGESLQATVAAAFARLEGGS